MLAWALPVAAQDDLYGDLHVYSQKACQGPDLARKFFPKFTEEDLSISDAITNELLFHDILSYLTGEGKSRTGEALQSNKANSIRSSPELLRQKQLMADTAHSNRLIDYTNRKRASAIQLANAFFAKVAKSDPPYAMALHNLFVCKAVLNSRHLLPPIQRQFTAAARHVIPQPPQEPRHESPYDGDCSCAGGNVCFGPRGGRYCITSGGNKRYGI